MTATIGLGIDAGGTYTDAVLFDFDQDRVLAKGKALTTPWDYPSGIGAALDHLDPEVLSRVQLTAVSTTLATNALVEGRGQDTGLLVMPPYGWRDVKGFRHSPLALIEGQLEIDGTELEPVNASEVREVARSMVARHGVTAFAVGGYASHANPSHELSVKALVREETGLHVTCSHELSEGLHYRVRAETAALNARIIPCLQTFLDHLRPSLTARGVTAPVMVVRSDGSLMGLSAALERPLETMLSGPAASVAGAAWLSGQRNGLVVDVGGTTTDTAIVRDGRVDMLDDGATIGGWQTHIRALNLRTIGLGGDSHIRLEKGNVVIGPRRVVPVAWIRSAAERTGHALAWLESRPDACALSNEEITLLAPSGPVSGAGDLHGEDRAVMDLLSERPRSLCELAHLLGKAHCSFLNTSRLEERHLVHRCALTPTDLLHAAGRLDLWDKGAAERIARLHAGMAGETLDNFVPRLLSVFQHTLASELLKKQLSADTDVDGIERQTAAMTLIRKALGEQGDGYSVRFELEHPVIGIGAPAGCFIPNAAALLYAEAVVPDHADVANAVGAVIGSILLIRHVTVSINERGVYRLGGVPDAPIFDSIEDATAYGMEFLRGALLELAVQAGAGDPRVDVTVKDSSAEVATGDAVFVERTIEGRVSGRPLPGSPARQRRISR